MKRGITCVLFLTFNFALSGQVGVNKTIPEFTLDVRTLNVADAAQINISNQDKSKYIRFYSGSDLYPDPSITIAPGKSMLFASYDDITFAYNEFLRISANGNIGIGTFVPSQKLNVNGKIKLGNDAITPEAGTMRYNSVNNSFEGYNGTEWVSMTYKPGVYTYDQNQPYFEYSNTTRDALITYPQSLTIEKPGKYMCLWDITFTDLTGNATNLISDRSIYFELQAYNQLTTKTIGPNVIESALNFRNFENIQMHKIVDIPSANQTMQFKFRVNRNTCCTASTSAYSIIDVKMTAIKLD